MGNQSSSSEGDDKKSSNSSSNSSNSNTSSGLLKKNSKSGSEITVYLNVYEPTKGQQSVPGFAVYHTGIELNGVEYCFAGGSEGSGVQEQTPRMTPAQTEWKYKETLVLGKVNLSSAELSAMLSTFRTEFPAKSYHIVHRNCNHFTEAVCTKLKLKYPSHINRAAKFGSFFTSMPKENADAIPTPTPEKKSVFETSKGYSLNDTKTSSSSTSSKKSSSSTTNSTTTTKTNPWKDPNHLEKLTTKKTTENTLQSAAPKQ